MSKVMKGNWNHHALITHTTASKSPRSDVKRYLGRFMCVASRLQDYVAKNHSLIRMHHTDIYGLRE